MSDLATFLASAARKRIALAQLTDTPVDDIKQGAAESLVTLQAAGTIVLPALRAAITGDPLALEKAVSGPLTDLVTTASRGTLTQPILWGNLASVIASSAGILAQEVPEHTARIFAVATNALLSRPLADAWTGELGPTFRRTTCCQVTARHERRCGDCVRLDADQ